MNIEKDLFDFVIIPTKKEFRKQTCIDKIYGIPKLNISPSSLLFNPKSYLINDAIINYNNEVFVAKVYFSYIKKYAKYNSKYNIEEYEFWAKKYTEQTIKELYSIYDKSIHIINYLYDLKIMPDINFKENVRNAIKTKDKKFYRKINSIYSRLYGDTYKTIIRDDITHNISNMFIRYIPIYENDKRTGWKIENALSLEEGITIIEDLCNLLEENLNVIVDKLKEFFPPKGTPEYNNRLQELNTTINSL